MFGEDYFSFAPKPAPTTGKNLGVHVAVLVFGAVFFALWLSISGF